jgi:UDP-N-acetylmuramoyl-L-alanyl-D-glutamate--2,6-diaminopimelate ligase
MSNILGYRASLASILKNIITVEKSSDQYVYGVAIDSRKVQNNFLFIAGVGEVLDARNFINDAVNNGASAIIYEASMPLEDDASLQLQSAQSQGIITLALENCSSFIGQIVSNFYMLPSIQMNMIGVTGTNGKSSCVNIIAQALEKYKHKAGVIGTLGWGFVNALKPSNMTTPDAVTLQSYCASMRDDGAQSVVLEVSSHALSQGRIDALQIDIAIFSNLTRDHLDYHKTMDEYAKAKLSLFLQPQLKSAVINSDDPFSEVILSNISKDVDVYLVSQQPCYSGYNNCFATNIVVSTKGVSFLANTPWGQGFISSKLQGKFQVTNLLLALPSLVLLGLSLEAACDLLSKTETIPGRAQLIGVDNKPTAIVDYAHTPDALATILQHARSIAKGKVWCVFGCGGQRDQGKRREMGMIAEKLSDEVVITDDNPRNEDPSVIVSDILSGIVCSWAVTIEHDRCAAIKLAINNATAQDIVVIAGKGHENVQIIADEYISHSDIDYVTSQIDMWESNKLLYYDALY